MYWISFDRRDSHVKHCASATLGKGRTVQTTVKMPETLRSVVAKFYDEYMHSTPKKLKVVDAYLFYVLLTGVIQFAYCCLVGTFPFNSFLSGFISTVGTFVLGGRCSIIQTYTFLLKQFIFFIWQSEFVCVVLCLSYAFLKPVLAHYVWQKPGARTPAFVHNHSNLSKGLDALFFSVRHVVTMLSVVPSAKLP